MGKNRLFGALPTTNDPLSLSENSEPRILQTVLFFIVSFVFVTLFSRSTSFLYAFEGIDSAMFKQMGLAILRGKTIYIDYFDNKGCLLYFLHAFGLWLGGNFPILLLQTLSLAITLIIWDKTLALFCHQRRRFISLAILLFLLMCFYEGGDLTEEWCLPFASYPIFVYCKRLKQEGEISHSQMFGIGVCFGIIAFYRINNASSFLGFIAYLWILTIQKKEFGKFVKSMASFLAGALLVATGCILYFYLKAGWQGVHEMFYATFLSNFEYLASKTEESIFLNYVPYLTFLLLSVALLWLNTAKKKDFLFPSLLSVLFFVCSFGSRCFSHYLMALLPLWMIILMNFDRDRIKIQTLLIAFLAIPLSIYTLRPLGFLVNDIILNREKFTSIYQDFHHCVENIPEKERDSIYVYRFEGFGVGMMQHEKLLQCNRVLYSPLLDCLPTLRKEETSKPFVRPKWILCSWDFITNSSEAIFIHKEYELQSEFPYKALILNKPKIGYEFQVYLYRRKDQTTGQ